MPEVSSAQWTDAEVEAAFDLDTAIASQRCAFEALGTGEAQLADKVAIAHAGSSDTTLCYLSKLSPQHGAVSKLVAAHPDNAERGLPAITATVLVLDNDTGRLIATLQGTALTAVRTAAASAVAADVLARADADVLAVLGSGVQARNHVRTIARVRRLRDVRVFSPRRAHREALAADLSAELGLTVRAVDGAAEAVREASIVATCTLSTSPVLSTTDLAPGTTVVAVGSFTHDRCEVDADLVRRAARVVVDDVGTAVEHAGPIVRAVSAGAVEPAALVPLGAVLLGDAPGRSGDDEIVYYNSVGLGVQDAAAAHAVLGTL